MKYFRKPSTSIAEQETPSRKVVLKDLFGSDSNSESPCENTIPKRITERKIRPTGDNNIPY